MDRLVPAPAAHVSGKDDAIEGLRGCAALAVLYAHLTLANTRDTFPFTFLDPHFIPPAFLAHIEMGRSAVLIFFMLSGYVIGLTNTEPFSADRARDYIFRRALRLLPVYFAAVALGWAVIRESSSWDLIGHLLLLQNAAADSPFGVSLMPGNVNLWSLHYEVIYYGLFLVVWWSRPHLPALFAGVAAVGALALLTPPLSLWLSWLACGFLFWLVGLAVAWRLRPGPPEVTGPWPSAILLSLAVAKFQPLRVGLAYFGYDFGDLGGVHLPNLDNLPPLLWLFLIITRRQTRWIVGLEMACWLYVALYIAWRVRSGLPAWHDPVAITIGITLLAAALRFWKPSLAALRRVAPIGAISYGIYAFGLPVQLAVASVAESFSGSVWTWLVRLVVALILTFALAWWLERIVQPRVRRLFS